MKSNKLVFFMIFCWQNPALNFLMEVLRESILDLSHQGSLLTFSHYELCYNWIWIANLWMHKKHLKGLVSSRLLLSNPWSFWINNSGLGEAILYPITSSQQMLLLSVKKRNMVHRSWVLAMGDRLQI
jgi:hypothetical protein